MPEDLKLSQIGSSPLPPPFRGLHSPGVRKHSQIIFACYFRKSSIPKLIGVLRDRKWESQESRVCIAGFSVCGCEKKSVVYETECIDMKHSERKAEPEPFIALKHIQATLYSIRSEMGSQCSFFFFFFPPRRGVECWWRGAKGTSLATKFRIFWRGWIRCSHEETVAVKAVRGYRK